MKVPMFISNSCASSFVQIFKFSKNPYLSRLNLKNVFNWPHSNRGELKPTVKILGYWGGCIAFSSGVPFTVW